MVFPTLSPIRIMLGGFVPTTATEFDRPVPKESVIVVPDFGTVFSAAVLDPLEQYRYVLVRVWDQTLPQLAVTMLNPSTATHTTQDATIRKVMGFARRLGYGGIIVVNLFAFRTSSPRLMRRAMEPVGKYNDAAIKLACLMTGPDKRVLCAWGVNGAYRDRDIDVCRIIADAGCSGVTLKLTDSGHPQHPLYLPGNSTLVPFEVRAA